MAMAMATAAVWPQYFEAIAEPILAAVSIVVAKSRMQLVSDRKELNAIVSDRERFNRYKLK